MSAKMKTRTMGFFLIDRITSWKVGESGEAVKNIVISDGFFRDHFPRRPVMPGVLMLEGMAQLTGLLLEAGLRDRHGREARAALVRVERAKFRGMALPGDTVVYRTTVQSLDETEGKAAVEAWRAEERIVEAAMTFRFQPLSDAAPGEARERLLRILTGRPPGEA